jgi:hypothetical protein
MKKFMNLYFDLSILIFSLKIICQKNIKKLKLLNFINYIKNIIFIFFAIFKLMNHIYLNSLLVSMKLSIGESSTIEIFGYIIFRFFNGFF